MDYCKHAIEAKPATAAATNLLVLALAVCRERGLAPTHWSQTDVGLDSAAAPGLMVWQGSTSLATIGPDGHMHWFVRT